MKITLLTQGIDDKTDNSVGNNLLDLFDNPSYNSFFFLSAFVTKSAIEGLSDKIEQAKKTYRDLKLIVGVNQKVTSKEALEAIISLDINSFIFFQFSGTIFHPKIYLFEGDASACLIVGSSNLTTQGLFQNVESSLMIEFSDADEDAATLTSIKKNIAALYNLTDPNLEKITQELIDDLVEEGIVPTEAERKSIYVALNEKDEDKDEEENDDENHKTEELLKSLFPKRVLPKIPATFRKRTQAAAVAQTINPATLATTTPASSLTLVWTRSDVPGSSVEIARSINTNTTGGLRLVQAAFKDPKTGDVIDQTSYFRNDVFGHLNWVQAKTKPFGEAAVGLFDVEILGNSLGQIPLTIRHKPSGEAGQGNYTTLISWSSISADIRSAGLTGSTVNLYQDNSSGDFKIEFI